VDPVIIYIYIYIAGKTALFGLVASLDRKYT